MKVRIPKAFLTLSLLPLLSGCFGWIIPSGDNEDYSIKTIELSHNVVTMGENQRVRITATGYTSQGYRADEKEFSWSIKNTNIASIEPSTEGYAFINSLTEGTTYLSVTSLSNSKISATSEIRVSSSPVIAKSSLSNTYKDYVNAFAESTSSAPLSGSLKALIIPVWFTDSSNYITNKDNVKADIQTVYLGSEKDTGWHSVKSFYEVESRGKLTFDGFVTDWFSCGYPSSRFHKDTSQATYTSSLVGDAFSWYKRKYGTTNLKDFDRDNDGYIDSIMLIYGAPDCRADSSNNDNMWAYCYWLFSSPNKTSPNVNAFFWASYDFMYDEFTSFSRAGKKYAGGDTTYSNLDAHTFIHEMGHIFGLDDYYDYSNQCKPAGSFSMQDCNVGSHDPFSRMAFGWDDPYVVTENTSIHLNPYQSSGDLVLLSSNPDSFSYSPFDEYILLELYTPTGLNTFDTLHSYRASYPTGALTAGIRIWHVDARLIDFTSYHDGQPITESMIKKGIEEGHIYTQAMSNTYFDNNGGDSNAYVTRLGEEYADYNILQLIHNSSLTSYRPNKDFTDTSLFKTGSRFTLSSFSRQFKNGNKMNDGTSFNWSINFKNVNGFGADIEITHIAS